MRGIEKTDKALACLRTLPVQTLNGAVPVRNKLQMQRPHDRELSLKNKIPAGSLGLWVLLLFMLVSPSALAQESADPKSQKASDVVVLRVAEPYVDIHTGPGRGYPVFHVVEQGEEIKILKRKANWYKVQAPGGQTGWVTAPALAHTLEPTGVPVDLPEVGYGDYLKSRWRVGFTGGQLEGSSTFSITGGYRFLSWAGVGIEIGQIFDQSVTGEYFGINLLVEPKPNWVVTPFVTVGAGQFSFEERQKLVVEDVGSPSYGTLGAGVSYYVGRNFVFRGEYRRYSISTDGDRVPLNGWTLGLNAFF